MLVSCFPYVRLEDIKLIGLGDHPHGGGRGKSKGNRIPVSPWGKQVRLSISGSNAM
jgi:hypothetical protein